MRIKRLLGGAAAAIAAVVLFGTAAFAASVTPNIITTDGQAVTVAASGADLPVGTTTAYIMECNGEGTITAANLFFNCASSTTDQATVAGGSFSKSFATIFKSTEAENGDVDWKCGPAPLGTPTGANTDIDGLRVYSTCQIRISPASTTNVDADLFLPITFEGQPEPVVPEAPLSILLPIGGVAVLGAAYLVLRRRPVAPVA